MKITIDFDSLVIGTGPIISRRLNEELCERIEGLYLLHDLTLRVSLSELFSFSDLNIFLQENRMEYWFQSVEVVTDASQYLVSDRAITSEQFLKITKKEIPDTFLFQEAVSWSQSMDFPVI